MIRTTAKWTFSPVSNVAKIYLGGTPKRAVPEYWGGDIKWASAADIASCNSRYIRTTTENITALGVGKSAAKILDKNTVVITARGTVGAVCLLSEPMAFNQSCYGLVCNSEIDPTFFYYALKAGIKQIKAQTYGAVFDTITIQSFDNITIPTPPIATQCKIAAILSVYDDLIENNTHRIRILEEMAQSIYREWFVNFRFPDQGKVRMVDSKLGKIPRGWTIERLEELTDGSRHSIVDGPFGTQMKISEYVSEGIPIVEMPHLEGSIIKSSLDHFITIDKYASVKRSTVKPGDIVISKTGTLGLLGIMPKEIEKAVIVSRLAKITPAENRNTRYLIFCRLKELARIKYWQSVATGSTMPIINLSHLKEVLLPVPNAALLRVFDSIVKSNYEFINVLRQQNHYLRKTRDLLLPRLIFGELDLSDLDIHTNDTDEGSR